MRLDEIKRKSNPLGTMELYVQKDHDLGNPVDVIDWGQPDTVSVEAGKIQSRINDWEYDPNHLLLVKWTETGVAHEVIGGW